MAKANAFSFLLLIVFLTTLEAEARESKYFSKFNPRAEQPPLKPSTQINTHNNYNSEIHESDFPTEEFIENINKDSSKTNRFPRDFGEHSYVSVSGGHKKKDSNDFYNPVRASTNGVFELSEEEKKFFNVKDAKNNYKDRENVHAKEAQGMSDTRTLENGKYYYNPVVARAKRGGEGYFGNREFKPTYDEFRPLKDFEYNSQNQVGFIP